MSSLALGLALAGPAPVSAQSTFGAAKPRATGRVSVFVDTWTNQPDDAPPRRFRELITSATFRAPETEENGVDYGLDLRHSGFGGGSRPERMSVYEGFAGARMARGRVRLRAGHVWLDELGALGSLAGGSVEVRQSPDARAAIGRLRFGAFGGLEPKIFDTGYYQGVRKYGAYAALDGREARRHTVGYINLRDGALAERAVVTTTNFVPVRRVFYVYQAAEYDLVKPAGHARKGLNFFLSNARLNAGRRVELQGIYNRGRSIDSRGLADDVVNGRPITQSAVTGLAYESRGGRITVEPYRRIRVYAGYSQDRTNREDRPANRLTVGGSAPNAAGSGFDLSASDTRVTRASGSYHSKYVSLGRQIGRATYLSADYSSSLSIVRFLRSSDGVVIEDRPTTRRVSGTGTINVGSTTSLHVTVDRMWDTGLREWRVLAGMSYRFR